MEASRKRGRRALALSLLCVSAAVAPPPPLPPPPPPAPQVWSGATNALPDPRLPHLPMLGNGAIGVLLDARDDTHANAAGGGGDNALDLYVGSGSLWSCGACASPAAGCCRLVALGGVSVSLRPTFGAAPPLRFSATLDVARGEARAAFATPGGGAVDVLVYMHPALRVVVANISYSPRGTDPAALNFDVSVWTPPAGPAPPEPKPFPHAGSMPAPMSAGCLAAGVAPGTPPMDCVGVPPRAAAARIAASRQASAGGPNTTAVARPVWAALAVALVPPPGSGADDASFSATTFNGTMQASARAHVAGDDVFCVVVAELEALTNETDPSAAAAALANSVAAAPGGSGAAAVAAAAAAFWDEFWARSGVALPSLPSVADLWGGAQFALAATASVNAAEVPPALFGVWATSDEVGWNGDMTLDYNQESTYYAAFASNHAPQFASYIGPILDWQAPARVLATRFAAQWNVSCDARALLYACHLAPRSVVLLANLRTASAHSRPAPPCLAPRRPACPPRTGCGTGTLQCFRPSRTSSILRTRPLRPPRSTRCSRRSTRCGPAR